MDQRRCYRDQDPLGVDCGESYLGDKERRTSEIRYNGWMFRCSATQLTHYLLLCHTSAYGI